MLNFWDMLFFDEIYCLYNSGEFTGNEQEEIEYTYFKAYNKIIRNHRKIKFFIFIQSFLVVCFFVLRIFMFIQLYNLDEKILHIYVTAILLLAVSFLLTIVDITMAIMYVQASKKYIEILFKDNSSKNLEYIIKSSTAFLTVLIILWTLGSHSI